MRPNLEKTTQSEIKIVLLTTSVLIITDLTTLAGSINPFYKRETVLFVKASNPNYRDNN